LFVWPKICSALIGLKTASGGVMKNERTPTILIALLFALPFGVLAQATPTATTAEPTKVELNSVPFQQVLDRLFGTSGTTGLISASQPFVFSANGVTLTPEQVQSFFAPTTATTNSLAALIANRQESPNQQIRLSGTIGTSPFNFMVAGRQLKLDGVSLTQTQLDSLVQSLQQTPGLHEAKIEALVDGQSVTVKLQTKADRMRIETAGANGKKTVREIATDTARELKSDNGGEHPNERSTMRGDNRNERAERADRPEKQERIERTERVERIERVERPDIDRPGRGR
jgi:hypothetical protein